MKASKDFVLDMSELHMLKLVAFASCRFTWRSEQNQAALLTEVQAINNGPVTFKVNKFARFDYRYLSSSPIYILQNFVPGKFLVCKGQV